MDAIERLVIIEDIKQLVSRRTRLIDGKFWDDLVEIYAEDIEAHHLGLRGNRAVVDAIARRLDGIRTIHQIHLPEIEVISATLAKGVFPMEDLLVWEEDGVHRWVHGYGHYFQTFTKVERGWVISDNRLTRQYIRQGTGEYEIGVAAEMHDPRFTSKVAPLPRDFA